MTLIPISSLLRKSPMLSMKRIWLMMKARERIPLKKTKTMRCLKKSSLKLAQMIT